MRFLYLFENTHFISITTARKFALWILQIKMANVYNLLYSIMGIFRNLPVILQILYKFTHKLLQMGFSYQRH